MSVLAIVIILFALAAGVTQLSTVSARSSETSMRDTQLFYLADSGAQIGNSMVLAAAGFPGTTSLQETIGGGSVSVNLVDQGADGILVTSTGTIDGYQKTVQMVIMVVLTGGYSAQGAAEFFVDDGVDVEDSGILLELNNLSTLSGQDHAADGTLLADQSLATYGLAMNQTPGSAVFDLTTAPTATLEGTPAATMNTAQDNGDMIQAVRSYARNSADVSISGTRTLGDAHTGSYGTAAAPALVYVSLDKDETLTLSQGFSGYGTLFIDIEEADEATSLHLIDTASWHGPVVMNFRGESEIDDGSAIVLFEGSSSVIGSVVSNLSAEEIEFDGLGSFFRFNDSSSLLYSSETTASAPGFVDVLGSPSIEVISYQSL